jgi:hypothetical protein
MENLIDIYSDEEIINKSSFNYLINNILENKEYREFLLVILNDSPENKLNLFIDNLELSINNVFQNIKMIKDKDITYYNELLELVSEYEYNPKLNINVKILVLLVGYLITDLEESGIDTDLYNKIVNLFTITDNIELFYKNYTDLIPSIFEFIDNSDNSELIDMIIPISTENNNLLEQIEDNISSYLK